MICGDVSNGLLKIRKLELLAKDMEQISRSPFYSPSCANTEIGQFGIFVLT